jgi:ATP-dependent protease Clp ATPase subunit
MYEIPSRPEVSEVIITHKVISEGKKAKMITHAKGKKAG